MNSHYFYRESQLKKYPLINRPISISLFHGYMATENKATLFLKDNSQFKSKWKLKYYKIVTRLVEMLYTRHWVSLLVVRVFRYCLLFNTFSTRRGGSNQDEFHISGHMDIRIISAGPSSQSRHRFSPMLEGLNGTLLHLLLHWQLW